MKAAYKKHRFQEQEFKGQELAGKKKKVTHIHHYGWYLHQGSYQFSDSSNYGYDLKIALHLVLSLYKWQSIFAWK